MDPDKSAQQFPLALAPEARIALLEQALGRLDDSPTENPHKQAIARRTRPGWAREHTILLAAASCAVATCVVYVLSMLTGVSPFDTGEIAEDTQLPQSTRQLLAFGELAFLALIGSAAAWMVVRRG
jgi:hypothetical protein